MLPQWAKWKYHAHVQESLKHATTVWDFEPDNHCEYNLLLILLQLPCWGTETFYDSNAYPKIPSQKTFQRKCRKLESKMFMPPVKLAIATETSFYCLVYLLAHFWNSKHLQNSSIKETKAFKTTVKCVDVFVR